MRSRILFYGFIVVLAVLDAMLIANPNLLGKLGFIIYKYSYLRTFPKALLTISMVVSAIVLVTEMLVFLSRRRTLRKKIIGLLVIIILVLVGVLVKTEVDFQSWSYGHTGFKLRYGAYLLPVILILVVIQGCVRVIQYKSESTEGISKS